MTSILLVEDDPDIAKLLTIHLGDLGYRVEVAGDGRTGLDRARERDYALVILDVMLPELDGFEVCKGVRAEDPYVPIMMLTARTEEEDQVEGLDVGADIYLGKPVSVSVILSQAKALLRSARRYADPPDQIKVHNLRIDRDRYLVFQKNGDDEEEEKELRMPRKEFELLYFLASHPGKVFSRQEILDEVWGQDVYVVDRTVDVHVRKIRQKIGSDYIETVKGVGYRMKE